MGSQWGPTAASSGAAASVLEDAGATILRYDRAEPNQVLHARVGELEMARLT